MITLPQRVSLATVIFEELERAILNDELKPGEQINEKALAERNGVSRGPIREACRRLEQAGLVEIIVNRGAFVCQISPEHAEELCDIRLVLSAYISKLAAKRITDAQIEKLTVLMEKIENTVRKGRLSEFTKLNADFHKLILAIAGSEKLEVIYTGINKELKLCRWQALHNSPDLEEALRGHRAIVEALSARDVAKASKAMHNHLKTANKRLVIEMRRRDG